MGVENLNREGNNEKSHLEEWQSEVTGELYTAGFSATVKGWAEIQVVRNQKGQVNGLAKLTGSMNCFCGWLEQASWQDAKL